MKNLPKELRIKAGMISMGEHIAWGSDNALMYKAATKIEELEEKLNEITINTKYYIKVSLNGKFLFSTQHDGYKNRVINNYNELKAILPLAEIEMYKNGTTNTRVYIK